MANFRTHLTSTINTKPWLLLIFCAVIFFSQLSTTIHSACHNFHAHTTLCDAFNAVEHSTAIISIALFSIAFIALSTRFTTPALLTTFVPYYHLSIRGPPQAINRI